MTLDNDYKFIYVRDSEDGGDYGLLAVDTSYGDVTQDEIDDVLNTFMEQEVYDYNLDDIADMLIIRGKHCEAVSVNDTVFI